MIHNTILTSGLFTCIFVDQVFGGEPYAKIILSIVHLGALL